MYNLTIIGLGPGDSRYISREVETILKQTNARIVLRTICHPAVTWLDTENIAYTSFDNYYKQMEDFTVVYDRIVDDLQTWLKDGDIIYVVPGSPLVAESTVQMLRLRVEPKQLRILSAMSFLDLCYACLAIDPLQRQLQIIDAMQINKWPEFAGNCLVTQVYSRLLATDVKLALAERYGDEHKVVLLQRLGTVQESINECFVYELDRFIDIDHLTSIYVPEIEKKVVVPIDIQPLVSIMAILRSPNGCLWDLQQTHASLRRFLVEEAYEILEAIDKEDAPNLCEELGDLLLQIVFHARVAEEKGEFTIADVVQTVCDKMIRRHPHVFADTTVSDAAEVLFNWEKIKEREKKTRQGILASVPRGLPSLLRACKLQEKAAQVGFDWSEWLPVWEKIHEELNELLQELHSGLANNARVEVELGDVLFSMVNLARKLGIEPETALNMTNAKFIRRFAYIEQKILESGLTWQELSLQQMDEFWQQAKKRAF